tara:strand:- start:169 stop:372 length:204 start_codon:yes stop_codon:yes gene_type:complete
MILPINIKTARVTQIPKQGIMETPTIEDTSNPNYEILASDIVFGELGMTDQRKYSSRPLNLERLELR